MACNMNTQVTDLAAHEQVVNTVCSGSMNNSREFKIPVHVMTYTLKLQVQVYVPVEGLFS